MNGRVGRRGSGDSAVPEQAGDGATGLRRFAGVSMGIEDIVRVSAGGIYPSTEMLKVLSGNVMHG
jgi:hypothetical protein